MNANAIVECVPNFSEGRDPKKIEAVAKAIRSVSNVTLLDVDPGSDTNRTVYTLVGSPESVIHAVLEAAKAARDCIDMRRHHGAHPRIGALDVCPFIPVSGISMDECIELADRCASRLAETLDIPIYLYERSARSDNRKSLANIRSGEYEGLEVKLKDPLWAPDFGPAKFDPGWGATVVGAREFLIAYNVNLNTQDKKIAHYIAMSIRESGRFVKDPTGSPVHEPGRLKEVRAIGWYIPEYSCAQVSINILDYRETPLHVVFETVKDEAEKRGVLVTGSELIGLIPLQAIVDSGRHFIAKMGKSPGLPESDAIAAAVRSMGLANLDGFDIRKKVIEYAIAAPEPLVSSSLEEFIDEVSRGSPVPGGGSVAALAGALGAALAAMVANLTVDKKKSGMDLETMTRNALHAQALRKQLFESVHEDSKAFAQVLSAYRLSKKTADDAEARSKAIEEASKKAALIPLSTARYCIDVMELCLEVAEKGNASSFADGIVGSIMAKAGFDGAMLNVKVNLDTIHDPNFVETLGKEMCLLTQKAEMLLARIQKHSAGGRAD